MRSGKEAQEIRQIAIGKVLGAAERQAAIGLGAFEAEPGVTVNFENPPRVNQQLLSRGRQHTSSSRWSEKRLPHHIFQPLHLSGDSGSGAADRGGRMRERAAFGEGEERSEQVRIESLHHFNIIESLISNNSILSHQMR